MMKNDFKSRFQKMELHLAYLAGAATVILGFLGWTYFHTIPTAIEDKINERIGKETEKKINDAVKKAETILEAIDLQDKVLKIGEEVGKINEEVETINKAIVKIDEARECKDPKEVCVCQRDEGKDKEDLAKLVVCVSRCPDGRLRGIEIKKIVATTSLKKAKCKEFKPKASWK